MKLWQKICIGMLSGMLFGIVAPEVASFYKLVGDGFLSLIHMIILPLVFASMTLGITSIQDPKKLGRVGVKTLLLYFGTTVIAVFLGIMFAEFFQPGSGFSTHKLESVKIIDTPPDMEALFISLVPKNPVRAFVEGNVLQVIFFSVLLGIAINLTKEKAEPFKKLIQGLADVMFQLTQMVMSLSPYGVFAIMAYVSATFGLKALIPMVKFLGTYYLACGFHLLIIFGGMLKFFGKMPFRSFIKGSGDAIAMAFSTCSSSASLPVALECAENNLGVPKQLANFMLPLGTTINMNGAAIFQGMSALFICQAYGIELTWHSLVTLTAVATFSAVGAAGIPGTGFIMLSVVLSSVGIPLEGLALLAGIDRVREMVSTVLNVLGDLVCAVCVTRMEQKSFTSSESI